MRYGVGIDLGTSFTSAAVIGPDGMRMVPLSRGVVVPSVAYATPEGTLLTGLAAEEAARGGELGRVARGFKRRIGDPTPLVLGGTAYSPDALMAAQLRDVLEYVTRMEGSPPETIMLTCPAIWGPYRREHFEEVPRLAGVPASHVLTEPEAVATHYSMERRLGDGEVVAVYDLGGGTFDTTILRMGQGGSMEILGTPEGIEHLGGMDFDETLLAFVDDRLGGAVSALDQTDPRSGALLAHIRTLCVRAKEELSIEPDVLIKVPLPAGPQQVMITRLELNDMLRPSVRLTTDALRHTIASAGLRTEDVSAMLLAGGSSRIPLVDQMVSEEFGRPVRMTLHPKFTVALGGAATAARVRNAADTAPPPRLTTPPGGVATASAPVRHRKWRVPVAAAVAVVAALVVATLFLVNGGNPEGTADAGKGTTDAGKPAGPAKTMQVYGKKGPVDPYTSFIASAENWAGVDITDGASQTAIKANPDGKGNLRVQWAGGAPGQVYMQNPTDSEDKTAYVNKGALVFNAEVHTPPTALVTVAVHCVYPCAAEVEATQLFRKLPKDKRTEVTIPLNCFTAKGLRPTTINTPFLVYTTGKLDVTFSDIRWEPDAASGQPAKRCANLK
ncbi:MAG TPA: Hsp70 family protein [Actinophytocola sp.]|jgi:actin-like ATPase involved in cell morphogenesis|nr:Hsp70 family protein [Actinophytocola sp.]